MRRARVCWLTLCLLGVLFVPVGLVTAGTGVEYGPVPPGIAGVVAGERDAALAQMALATLEERSADHELAAALLVMLDDVGLKAAATRLAKGAVRVEALPHLLEVVASSEHPEADVLLERAAAEARPVLRMIAADGLGRGRSPSAVTVLARLTLDEVPGVRIAALRSLFALETPQAAATRMAVPADGETDLLATRLRWHRRCEDVSPGLGQLAEDAYRGGRTVPVRMAAARYLSMPAADTPAALLDAIVREMGSNPMLAWMLRRTSGQPMRGYDAVEMRRIAIDATLTLLERPALEPARRAALIDLALGWVAHPVAMDPYKRDPIPEYRLRRLLPDLGAEILAPVMRRLRRGDFADPRQGVILVRELGEALALPALRELLAPRAEKPPFESRAETQRRRYVRNAAAGALQELGRIGDEALARALLLGDEAETLKVDIVHALAKEPGAWAVPLLGELVAGEDRELRKDALNILERRKEPQARQILIDDLFARMERPHDRLPPLVTRGDEPALEVVRRALKDERSYMRKAALHQFLRRRNPRLCGAEGREVLLGHRPDMRSRQEIQDYIHALLNADPARVVPYVREHWQDFPTDGVRMTALRILMETTGQTARRDAMDLALSKIDASSPLQMLTSAASVFMGPEPDTTNGGYAWDYRVEEIGAFWRRLLGSEDVRLQRQAIAAYTHTKAPDVAARLLELLAKARAGKAIAPDASTPAGEHAFAGLVVRALRYQPWGAVEKTLIDVALDPLGGPETRLLTAQVLIGKLSDTGRRRLIDWLEYTQPTVGPAPDTQLPGEARPRGPGVHAYDVLQLFLAAAIGEKAGPAIAATLYGALRRELFEYYSPERLATLITEGTTSADEALLDARVVALARGIGHAGHAPTVEALLDLVFDMRFAIYARACAQHQATFTCEASAASAAVTPSPLSELSQDDGGMPTSIYGILYQVKLLDDDALAAAMARVLRLARDDGRLSQFPALFLYRVVKNMLDKHTGRKPKTAAVVLRYAMRVERLDGPIQFNLADESMRELAEAGRFAEAAAEQRHVVRILARGNHDDRAPGLWLFHRAVQDALEAAAAAQRGDAGTARNLFRRAVLRAPNNPDVLNTVAWYRALADFELDQAEAEATRATTLEARVENRPSANAADTLAYVLLKRGRPREGIAVLWPRIGERSAMKNGLLFMHMGQLYANASMFRSARDALVEALTWDRALEGALREDPLLAKLREKVTIDKITEAAAQRRLEEDLP